MTIPLDLRTTKCPLNFVKAKLALEKIPIGDILEVWIAVDGESALNIPNSIQQEGHQVVRQETIKEDHYQRLLLKRCH